MVTLEDKYIQELNFDAINKNIEQNLNLISKYPRNSFLNSFIVLTSENKLPANPKKAIIDLMKIEQLIDVPNEHMLNVTKLGYEVVRKGGWNKHLERERIKSERSDKKDIYDFKTSKWKQKTFFWFFGFAVIGSSLSVYNFAVNLSPTEKEKKLQQQQELKIHKMEEELTKLHISTLVQKNLDSLHSPKVLTKKIDKEE
ncbi:hypothetical protein SAMN02745938_1261 [Flavobacterium psychrophilum DSM 3660]|uniref:hypothetical protein n=1 Tax=Flavobacterium psychrophilum TaxID=96345 RepID=UPI0004F657EE|nr:hypothetical protein [Flavobacterium psychrophilum]AIN75169.1 hypothetical protein FPG3_07055 [Flavobacterium psychrophilum FPG3]EKT2072823.1 hypothetical protein [Flavobacterium psychrophilum]EKT4492233.1 hypothetical protein [Flavobacterium psychrophilum]MBF2045430.1 hypothetical protein [Flavobacterium psychrophilum]OXB15477.1 hypothetical protein B0A57_00415 [Flavobacterium psychrophilum DSM 3660 = ATCC 49418]